MPAHLNAMRDLEDILDDQESLRSLSDRLSSFITRREIAFIPGYNPTAAETNMAHYVGGRLAQDVSLFNLSLNSKIGPICDWLSGFDCDLREHYDMDKLTSEERVGVFFHALGGDFLFDVGIQRDGDDNLITARIDSQIRGMFGEGRAVTLNGIPRDVSILVYASEMPEKSGYIIDVETGLNPEPFYEGCIALRPGERRRISLCINGLLCGYPVLF